jgi:16S rRNA U516 pseudouridylate synthase RsuA-like enzyme
VTDDATPPTRLRLQKILADAGVASRRAAERLITAGRVSVNGAMITTLGATADPASDEVCLDGKALTRRSGHIYVALNKPLGYVTTASDERGRPTALDLVRDVPARLFPVGRLDRDSEGLLLLTTDGALTEWLTHPRHEIEKEYMALVDQEPSPDALAALATGITLAGRRLAAADVARGPQTAGAAHVRGGWPAGAPAAACARWPGAAGRPASGRAPTADSSRVAGAAADGRSGGNVLGNGYVRTSRQITILLTFCVRVTILLSGSRQERPK